MTNFGALDTLTVYSKISKIRILIKIEFWGNASIQMNLSKNKS